MSLSERAFNYFLGLSVLLWAVMGLATADGEACLTSVRLVISGLNTVVGTLLILRTPVKKNGSALIIAICLPSVIIAGWALKTAPPPQDWPLQSQIIFSAGGLLAMTAFIFLGRSFAVLPAMRNIVIHGPFRIVRHPAYLGEWLMIFGCCIAKPSMESFLPVIVSVPLIAARILAEEHVLANNNKYIEYMHSVRWRLVPGLW